MRDVILIELTVQKLRTTERAVLVTLGEPDAGVWLQLSQVELHSASEPGLHVVVLPEWLATEKGLI